MLPAHSEECIDFYLGGARITYKYILTDEDFKKQVENARINTRAWVMQERYMSPRSLHFGRHQLFWECREAEAAETNPFGVILGKPGLKSQYEDLRDYPDKKSLAGTCNAEPGCAEFYRLVKQYADCAPNLSFSSDKLIAFSAILKHYATVHNEEIVAGMRRRYLEDDLLWTRTYGFGLEQADIPCYESYIAPSWSWASVSGKVRGNKHAGERILIHVEDYKLDYVTDDSTGAIRGGWLRLSGLLKPIKMLRHKNRIVGRSAYWVLQIDGFELRNGHLLGFDSWTISLDSWVDNFDQDNDDGTLFCMAATRASDPHVECATGSLLLKLVEASTGTFRRLGVVWGGGKEAWNLLTANDEAVQRKLPCIKYKNGRHSIYII